MGKKNSKTKCPYSEQIHIRVSEKDKKQIKKLAEKTGIGNTSKYMRMQALNGELKEGVTVGIVLVLAEELVRYVEEKYDNENEELRRKVDELWELCS